MGKDNAKKTKKGFKTFRRIRNIVLAVIIAFLTAFIILTMITRLTGGTPSVFGYSMFRVSSGSMKPQLEIGDVIITKEFNTAEVKREDIVTYKSKTGVMNGKLVTHRVVKGPYKKGNKIYVVTKGDANNYEDEPINVEQIQSKFVTKVTILKSIYNVFVTPAGLLILIGLIIFAFFIEIIIFVKAVLGIGYEDKPEESVDDIIARYQKQNTENKLPDSEENPEEETNSGG